MSKRANKKPTPKIQPPPKKMQQNQQGPPISELLLQLGTQMDKIKTTYNDVIMGYENIIKQWTDNGIIDQEKLAKFNAKLQSQQQQKVG